MLKEIYQKAYGGGRSRTFDLIVMADHHTIIIIK
jgi:hypothetical protein